MVKDERMAQTVGLYLLGHRSELICYEGDLQYQANGQFAWKASHIL